MRALITGASGQVGRELVASVPAGAELLALTRGQLDISDATAVHAAAQSFRPSVIINAAAFTAVDLAETQSQRAADVNTRGARHLAQAAHALPGCRMLQVSTDYVFDGRASAPYGPEDVTNPLSVYGRTKLDGERAVFELLAGRAAVLRTSWVYASAGKNFVLTMLRLMRERGVVRVVSDQRGSPTAAGSVANALWRLASPTALHGIFHWTDAGVVSWYDFAGAIAQEAAALGLLPSLPDVQAISSAEYPTAAARPMYSALDTTESARRLGLVPTPWRTSLRKVLEDIQAQSAQR